MSEDGDHDYDSSKSNNTSKIKSVANSSHENHTIQLDFCDWLADSSMTGCH